MSALLGWFCIFITSSYFCSTGVLADTRTRLFLNSNSESGTGVEDHIMATNERTYGSSMHSDAELAILAGNYGDFGAPVNFMMKQAYKDKKKTMDKTQMNMEGRSLSESKKKKANPMAMVNIQGREYPYGAVQEAIQALLDGPDIEDKSDSMTGSYQILKCLKKTALCALTKVAPITCFLHCVMESNQIMARSSKVLPLGIALMCGPLGTIFDLVMKEMDLEISKVRRLPDLLEIYGTDVDNFRGYAYKAMDALHTQAIKYMDHPDMTTLRQGMEPMMEELGTEALSFEMLSTLGNPQCMYLNLMQTSKKFIDIFNQKPRLMDIMLPGYSLARMVSNSIPGRHQTMFSSFFKAINIITGANCGLIYFAEKGSDTECAVSNSSSMEAPMNPLTSSQSKSCGTVPSFPSFSWNLGFKIPLFQKG